MQKYRGCHRAAIAIYCDFSDGNHNLFLFFIENLHLQHFMEKLQQIVPPMGLSAAIRGDSDADNDADNASLGTICCNPLR